MNALLKVPPPPDAAKIAHSVMAYDLVTEQLDIELPIPLFLDTLALKIAKVPPDDKYGALSYPLEARAVDTFRFLLGLDVDMLKREYFLESTVGHAISFGPKKIEAVELLTQVTPRPRYARADKPRFSERELVVPTLRLLDDGNRGWMATSDVIARLTELFAPSGQDAEILEGRHDSYFSQKVRNMISHRDQPSSFIHKGLAHYERHGLQISDEGRSTVRALLS
ncbi:MAG: hypothetical protein ABSE20_04455 [Acetobacteraceae bacterium]